MTSIDIAPGRSREHGVASTGRSLAPLAGCVAAALLLAAFLTQSNSPDETASAAKVVSFYSDHRTSTIVSSILAVLSTPFFVMFAASAREGLRRDGSSRRWTDAALIGGALAAVGLLTAGMVSFALADGAHHHYAPAAMQALNVISADSWVVFVPGFGVLAISIGAAILSSKVLARWLGRLVLAIGILCFIPFASFFAFVAAIIWVPLVSVKLSSVSS
jgi:hypothetical protein